MPFGTQVASPASLTVQGVVVQVEPEESQVWI
jgi:hypothetical protein